MVVGVLQLGAFSVVRPHWWPPLRISSSNLDTEVSTPPSALVLTAHGVADRTGHLRAFPPACLQSASNQPTQAEFEECLTSRGITQRVGTYQPASRITAFQWAEGGAFLLLSAGAVGATARLMRRDPPA